MLCCLVDNCVLVFPSAFVFISKIRVRIVYL